MSTDPYDRLDAPALRALLAQRDAQLAEQAAGMEEWMHAVSHDMQVIVITHLPQVAAKGDAHFKVYKTDADTRTVTGAVISVPHRRTGTARPSRIPAESDCPPQCANRRALIRSQRPDGPA